MANLDQLVDTFEVTHSKPFPKSGGSYAGNPFNFFEGFNSYRKNIRDKTVSFELEEKLEQLKEEAARLPWE